MRRILIAVLAAGVLLAGCGSDSPSQAQPSGQESPVTDMPSDSPSPSDPPSAGQTPSASPGPEEGPAAAMNDLAKRLGIDAQDVTVVSAQEVSWPDGSLGCPEPGKMYTQMIVEGSVIVLEANGKQYEYHAANGRAPFYCEKPQPPVR